MWNKIASFILRYRTQWLIAILLLTGVMGFLTSKTQMAYELQKIIPDNDTTSIVYEKFKKTFGEDGSVMVIGVATDKLYTPAFFSDWCRLSNQIDSLPDIEKIISLSKLYRIVKSDTTGKFTIQPVVEKLPETDQEMQAIKNKIDSLPFYRGYLFNDENATLIAVTLTKEATHSKRRVELTKNIEKMAKELGKKHDVDVHLSGVPYIRTINTEKISKELLLFTFLSIVVTAIFLLFFFQSLQIVISSLIVVIISLIYTIGSMYIFGYKIGILTALIPPLIVVIAIQNCIYLLNVYHFEYRNHGNKMKALTRVISKIGLASFLTNVTTAIGFGVFCFSGSSLLDEFSIISALNIMVVYVLCTILIPVIFSFLPAPTSRQLKHLDRKALSGILSFVNNVIFHHRKKVYLVTVLLLIAGGYGISRVKNIGYLLDGISPKEKLAIDLRFFESNFKGLFPFEIWIDTKEPGKVKDLAVLRKIEILQKQLLQYDELSKPISITEMVKFANQAYYDGNPRRYLLPNPLDLGGIMNLMPGNENKNNNQMLKSLVDSNYQIARVSMQIADVGSVRNTEITNELRQKIDSIFDPQDFDVQITGKSVVSVKGNSYLIENLIESLIWAFVSISILMALLFSSWKMILISLVPNLIPLLLTLGIMGYFNIPLKESTILIFGVAYGIVVDLTIHFLAKYRIELKKHNWNITESVSISIESSGFSMIYTTVVLFFGFVIFAFSSFGGTVYLGLLTSICLAIGLIANLFLLPSLLLSLEKRMNMRKEMETTILEIDEEALD